MFTLNDRPPLDRPLIGFIRVSTKRQGEAGESQEAQIAAINVYAQGLGVRPVAIYGDVGTGVGKRAHEINKELQEAAQLAKRVGGILVVTTVSRLGRDRAVIDWLDVLGVDVVSLDHGRVLNQNELRRAVASAGAAASTRRSQVRAGLKAAKARGVKLGNPKIAKAQPRGTIGSIVKKETLTEEIAAALKKHDPQGTMKAKEVAQLLNRQGIRTGHDLPWNEDRVRRHVRSARRLLSSP